MAGTYRFRCYSLQVGASTEVLGGELPFNEVQFTQILNGAGQFQGTLKIDDPRAGVDPIGATNPGQSALYVDRDGVIVWGGIITQRHRAGQDRKLKITADEFWSYLGHRLVLSASGLTATTTVSALSATYSTAVDILAIARDLVRSATTNGIGIVTGTELAGAFLSEAFVVNWSDAKSIADLIGSLSKMGVSPTTGVALGFDFAIDLAYDTTTGLPVKTFRLGYPRRGRIAGSTGLMFDLGGPTVDYDWLEDATQMANHVIVVGAGQGITQLTGSAADLSQVVPGGFPLWEQSLSFKNVTAGSVLRAQGASYINARAVPPVLPIVTFGASTDNISGVQIGSFIIGDDVRLFLEPGKDTLFTTGIDAYYRIVASQVNLANDGGFEAIRLTFTPAGSF